MSTKITTILIAALVTAIIVFMMCAFQVRFTETVVVTRLAEIHRVIPPEEAGLHFKWFWPIDELHRFDARLRSFETEFRQIGTKDQKTVILTAYATWRVADAERLLKSVGREDTVAGKIRDLLENRVSDVLRTHELSELVNIDPEKIRYAEIEQSVLEGIQGTALQQYGVEVVSVGIKRLGLPEIVTREVFTRMKEDRQRTIKQLTAEGEAEARKIRAEAEEISQKILARAEAYAKTLEGQADAEAAKYYRTFAENRRLSDFLKKLETVRRIFEAGQITLVMDANEFVPFDVLRDKSRASAATQPAAPAGEAGEAAAGRAP